MQVGYVRVYEGARKIFEKWPPEYLIKWKYDEIVFSIWNVLDPFMYSYLAGREKVEGTRVGGEVFVGQKPLGRVNVKEHEPDSG